MIIRETDELTGGTDRQRKSADKDREELLKGGTLEEGKTKTGRDLGGMATVQEARNRTEDG